MSNIKTEWINIITDMNKFSLKFFLFVFNLILILICPTI